MINRKLGIGCGFTKEIPYLDQLDMIKNAGFDCFFTGFDNIDVKALKNKADKLGLIYDTIHASFKGINFMWLDGDECLPLHNSIMATVDACAEFDIPTFVLHISSGKTPPDISAVGLKRFDEIVNRAASKNVNVAFENQRKLGNLSYLMERYQDLKNVGFCYDFGHEHCFTKNICFGEIFGRKTLCTHIHDNFGMNPEWDDCHILPFDGDIDFVSVMKILNKFDYKGALTLEVTMSKNKAGELYNNLTPEQYLQLAYERLKKVAEIE